MPNLIQLLQQGNALWYIPSAIFLGALHGLEPGHSKTMMAAFIIAIRGTMTQALMLGLAATISHTAVVWLVALAGLYFGSHWNAETSEPYFQLLSGVMIAIVGIWMFWRTWSDQHHHHHDHSHNHHHHDHEGHDHHDHQQHHHQHHHHADHEHHHSHAQRAHDEDHHHHHHDHHHDHHHHEPHEVRQVLLADSDEYQDAHQRAHAEEIQRRFQNRQVSNGQIIMFGLTGGLIPCPASITVLLLCLQLKQVSLGATLVLCFSIGLALTLVASGVLAAISVRHVSRHWKGFDGFARKAPYLSAGLILLLSLYLCLQGWRAIG